MKDVVLTVPVEWWLGAVRSCCPLSFVGRGSESSWWVVLAQDLCEAAVPKALPGGLACPRAGGATPGLACPRARKLVLGLGGRCQFPATCTSP